MMYLIIDIFVYRYTKFNSYFFLFNINNHSLLYNILISFVLDFIILKTYFVNLLFCLFLYFIKKKFVKRYFINYYKYLFINIFIFIFYLVFNLLIFKNFSFNYLFSSLFIYILFLNVCYIKEKKSI